MTELASLPSEAKTAAPTDLAARLYAAYVAGRIDRETFTLGVLAALHVARSAVAIRAEVALLEWLAAHGLTAHALGIVPPDYSERDAASLETVLDNTDTAETRLERFVSATVEQYARDAVLDAAAQREASGWIWRTSGESCDYCRPREGRRYEVTDTFRDHPGCDCYPEPIFDTDRNENA